MRSIRIYPNTSLKKVYIQILLYFRIENRFDRQERIENEEDKRNSREGTRVEETDGRNSSDEYVYKKQLRYHDAREQVISRKYLHK